jgi:hypothetical protein
MKRDTSGLSSGSARMKWNSPDSRTIAAWSSRAKAVFCRRIIGFCCLSVLRAGRCLFVIVMVSTLRQSAKEPFLYRPLERLATAAMIFST